MPFFVFHELQLLIGLLLILIRAEAQALKLCLGNFHFKFRFIFFKKTQNGIENGLFDFKKS